MDKLENDGRLALSARVRWRAVGDEGVLVHLDQGRVLVVVVLGVVPDTKSSSTSTSTRIRGCHLLDGIDFGFKPARNLVDGLVIARCASERILLVLLLLLLDAVVIVRLILDGTKLVLVGLVVRKQQRIRG